MLKLLYYEQIKTNRVFPKLTISNKIPTKFQRKTPELYAWSFSLCYFFNQSRTALFHLSYSVISI